MQFQSSLPRRERRFRQSERQVLINFYPRSREGSDKGKSKTKVPMNISIHAPAKGATKRCFKICRWRKFQPTLPRRERLSEALNSVVYTLFQSTLPRRERLLCMDSYQNINNFNPRSREGSDDDSVKKIPYIIISIHAPAKGATRINGTIERNKYISIHAPAKGATLCKIRYVRT